MNSMHILQGLFFDEDRLDHGDEPHTCTNLTYHMHSFGQYALGQCVQTYKKQSMIIHRVENEE